MMASESTTQAQAANGKPDELPPGAIPITTEQLLARIGAQTLQIEGLQQQLGAALARVAELEESDGPPDR